MITLSGSRPAHAADLGQIRDLLLPDIPCRVDPNGGYLDVLPDRPIVPGSRSQSLWMSNLGPRTYLRLVQPLIRFLAAPPDADDIAPGLRLAPGAAVLDVGCGPGVITAGLARAVAPGGVAVGLDVSASMLARAAEHAEVNLALIRADAQRLPFRDGTFDAVCSTAAVMLVDDPLEALTEMMRVLKRGGRLIVVVPSRGQGLTGRIAAGVGSVAGGRMFGPDEIASSLDRMDVDRIHSQSNGLISTTYARKTGA